jgi:phage/plasmid primase-like uncharacterized protein
MADAILEAAQAYGAPMKRVGACEYAGPCPSCGGRDRFSVNTKKQIWNCRSCGVGGDTIALVQHAEGVNFLDAVEKLTGGRWKPSPAARVVIAPNTVRAAPEASDEAGRLKRAATIWNAASPIARTDGEAYLERRGIFLDDVPEHGGLRWAPRCPWEAGTAPCIVARYTEAVMNEPRGLWRRPITGEKPKALGPTAGCVIRLWPDDEVDLVLVLGEGVETTLAAATRITHRGTYLRPAWAAGSAANMAAFPALTGIESLTLLVDNDENGAGQLAAGQCARRWADVGKEVIRLTPGKGGVDFNDLVRP